MKIKHPRMYYKDTFTGTSFLMKGLLVIFLLSFLASFTHGQVCTAVPPFDITQSFPEYAIVVKNGAAQFAVIQQALGYNSYISAVLDTDGVFSHGFYMGTIPVNITIKVWYQANNHPGPEIVEPVCSHQEGRSAYRPDNFNYDLYADANLQWVEDRFGRLHNPHDGACDFNSWVQHILENGDAPDETDLVPAPNCTDADIASHLLSHGGFEVGRLVYGPLSSPFLTARFVKIGSAFKVETLEGFTGRKRSDIPKQHQPAIDYLLHRQARKARRIGRR